MKKTRKKIGLFGGTFNPVHFGHLRVAEEVRERLGFDKVLFIPSCNPPLKSGSLASGRDRYEMTRLSVLGNPFFEISDVECRKPGKSYTVETYAALMKEYPDTDLSLIVGIDSFLDIPAWYQPERLMALASFVVISRPGFRFADLSPLVAAGEGVLSALDRHEREVASASMKNGREAFLMNVTPFHVSATSVRACVREGRSIKYLLPDEVESYIISHNLYREGSDPLRKQE